MTVEASVASDSSRTNMGKTRESQNGLQPQGEQQLNGHKGHQEAAEDVIR